MRLYHKSSRDGISYWQPLPTIASQPNSIGPLSRTANRRRDSLRQALETPAENENFRSSAYSGYTHLTASTGYYTNSFDRNRPLTAPIGSNNNIYLLGTFERLIYCN